RPRPESPTWAANAGEWEDVRTGGPQTLSGRTPGRGRPPRRSHFLQPRGTNGRVHLPVPQLSERPRGGDGHPGGPPEEHGALDDVAPRPGAEGARPQRRPSA